MYSTEPFSRKALRGLNPERLVREATVTRIAPFTEQWPLSFIADKVLDLSKSYQETR